MGNIYFFFLIYRSSGKKDSASGSSTIHRRVKMNGGSISDICVLYSAKYLLDSAR
jgi:hypothetical protein